MLKERRKTVLEPVLCSHEGRIAKVTGDGVLVEFASAVNAVWQRWDCNKKGQGQRAFEGGSQHPSPRG